MFVKLALGAIGVAVAAVLSVAGGSDASVSPVNPGTSPVMGPAQAIVLPARGYREQAKDISDVLANSDECIIGQVTRQEADFWPDRDPQTDVFSIFVVRVEKSLKGQAALGTEVRLMVPGGRMAVWGNPTSGGSFKPLPGEQSVFVQYADHPFPRNGQRELVCVTRFDGWADSLGIVYVPSPDARFEVAGTQLASIVPPGESSQAVREALLGADVDGAWRELESSLAAKNP